MIKKLITIIFLMSATCSYADIVYDETGLTITDFEPDTDSPCLDVGEDLSDTFTTDFNGTLIDVFNLGAFELPTEYPAVNTQWNFNGAGNFNLY
jgi:hypothetical protein